MTHFSLAHLTTLTLNPPQMIRAAARAGYQSVGLRLLQVTPDSLFYPLMSDPPLMRETKRAMAETGIKTLDIEFLKITPETNVKAMEPFLQAGAELGARYAIAAPYDPDLSRLADRFAALCDLALPYGISFVLEFFPWTVVPGLMEAAAILDKAQSANAGILVDALHFDRSGSTMAQLKSIAPERLPFLHLCDAPAIRPATLDGVLHEARAERLPPGEGGLDLKALLRAMPADIPIALEVPMTKLTAEIGPERVALRLREAAQALLERIDTD